MILERDIEAKVVKWAKANDWLTYKFVSPSQRGVPDRIFIKDGVVVFVEFKAPGKWPTKLQQLAMHKLRSQGAKVFWSDSAEDAVSLLEAARA